MSTVNEADQVRQEKEHREYRCTHRFDRPLLRRTQAHEPENDAVGACRAQPLQAEPVFRVGNPQGCQAERNQQRCNDVGAVRGNHHRDRRQDSTRRREPGQRAEVALQRDAERQRAVNGQGYRTLLPGQ